LADWSNVIYFTDRRLSFLKRVADPPDLPSSPPSFTHLAAHCHNSGFGGVFSLIETLQEKKL
jgi:hypothetical protein